VRREIERAVKRTTRNEDRLCTFFDQKTNATLRHGAGTERLEQELPGPVFRLDADVQHAGAVLARFLAVEGEP